MNYLKITIYLFLLMAVMAGPGLAIEAAPETYVADRAGVLDTGTKQQIIGLLQELEQKTNIRVIMLTVPTTDGVEIHDYAFERADQWRFGSNNEGADALFVIAVQDRKWSIHAGYNVEGIITDARAGQIGRENLVPHLKANDYDSGVLNVAIIMADEIAAEYNVELTGVPDLRQAPPQGVRLGPIARLLPLLLIFFFLSMGRGRSRSGLFWGMMLGSSFGRSYGSRGGFGGGGFGGGGGGGGFGGFGGGGGGGFGGGGASGSW